MCGFVKNIAGTTLTNHCNDHFSGLPVLVGLERILFTSTTRDKKLHPFYFSNNFNQPINQSKQIYIVPYVASESEAQSGFYLNSFCSNVHQNKRSVLLHTHLGMTCVKNCRKRMQFDKIVAKNKMAAIFIVQ